jgi:tRNA nucleotidyltransferase (CCA-adding enzyme)
MEFEPYLTILKRLNDHGHTAYFVGGCVRDFYLKRKIIDVDIATSAPQKLVERLFYDLDMDLSAEYFGVVTLKKPVKCQIATYRVESDYFNHRYPRKIEFVDDVNLDAHRRDFTVNALYLSMDMTLIDPLNGKYDLDKRILRCIGNPFERLNEDALRILRAIRFSVVLDFEIEPQLLSACIDLSSTLVYLKENSIELERRKIYKRNLSKVQINKLEHYKELIPNLCNYF